MKISHFKIKDQSPMVGANFNFLADNILVDNILNLMVGKTWQLGQSY